MLTKPRRLCDCRRKIGFASRLPCKQSSRLQLFWDIRSGREIHFVVRLPLERGVGYMLVVLLDVKFDEFTYRSDGVERVQE